MTAEDDIDRLDRVGQNAAREARVFNQFMNHSDNGMVGAPMRPNSLVGKLAVLLALWFVFNVSLGAVGVPSSSQVALGAALAVGALWLVWNIRKASASQGKAEALQAELHDLKKQEFNLKYEQARQDGMLDRFDGKGAD